MKQRVNKYVGLFLWIMLVFISCNNKQEEHSGHEDHSVHQQQAVNLLPGDAVVSSQRAIKPVTDSTITTGSFSGYIVPDERRTQKITARIGGRIEKLHVKYPYQYVKKGQLILELYSPEISKYLEEYLYLIKQNESALTSKAKEKLKLLGLTESQLASIEKTGKVPHTLSVYAPQSGYILPEEINTNSAKMPPANPIPSDNMGGMAGGNTPGNAVAMSASWLREGMYVNRDQDIFSVNDLKSVWGIVMGSTGETSAVKEGDKATLKGLGNKPMPATVDFIEPFFNSGQKFTRIRFYINNADNSIRVNSVFSAEIHTPGRRQMTIPATSVLDLGERKIVWVKTGKSGSNNIFSAREIKTGGTINNRVIVVSGLSGTDEVAEQAGYVIDSETLLKHIQ